MQHIRHNLPLHSLHAAVISKNPPLITLDCNLPEKGLTTEKNNSNLTLYLTFLSFLTRKSWIAYLVRLPSRSQDRRASQWLAIAWQMLDESLISRESSSGDHSASPTWSRLPPLSSHQSFIIDYAVVVLSARNFDLQCCSTTALVRIECARWDGCVSHEIMIAQIQRHCRRE